MAVIISFALAFLVAASLGQRMNVAALAMGSVLAFTAATLLSGSAAGLVALVGLQVGYLAGHAALVLQHLASPARTRSAGDV